MVDIISELYRVSERPDRTLTNILPIRSLYPEGKAPFGNRRWGANNGRWDSRYTGSIDPANANSQPAYRG